MLKYISTLLLVLLSIFSKAQVFSYADNYISDATPVSIIGQVKDNIIVWCKGEENYKGSVIMIYNKKLKLIKKVSTDILHSDIDPSATFYNSNDFFYVAYEYEKGNTPEYKLSAFDANGNLSSTYTIDTLNNINSDDSLSYNFYQSADKKILGCVKTISNKKYNALQFECSFLKNGNLYRDKFFLPFDNAHEKIVDILIDSNKNITLLKTSNTDSGFSISVIKKEFASDQFLIAAKNLAAGNLRDGTSHIFNKLNSYTVYGVWQNATGNSVLKNQKYKTGLYTWTVNDTLTDMPGDTILYDDSAKIFQFNRYANSASSSEPQNIFGVQTDSIPVSNPSAVKQTGEMVWQGSVDGKTGYYNYIKNNAPTEIVPTNYKASLTVISLDKSNKIKWRNELKNDEDNTFLFDFSNNKIAAGKKGIHIVSSTTVKKKNTIAHILVTYSGNYEKVNTIAWRSKYAYLVSNAVQTNDGALIIPCLKDNRLTFAKMILE